MKQWKLLKTDEKCFNIAFGLFLFNQSFLQPLVVLFQRKENVSQNVHKLGLKEG